MKLGISAFAWTSTFTEPDLAILPFVRRCGYQAFELPMFHPTQLATTPLRRALEANNLAPTICAILPAGINPIDPDAAARRAARAHLAACIQTAAELGATLLGGPLYAPIGYLPPHRPTPDEHAWATEIFHSLTPLLDATGITLALEPVNRSETFFLRTAADAAALCAAINHPRIGVTVDTFHANIEEKNLPAAIQSLGPTLRHMHLSENDRGTLGQGHIPFTAILQTLAQQNYNGYLIVEGFGFPTHNRPAPGQLWADPKTSPEQLATASYAHLRSLLS